MRISMAVYVSLSADEVRGKYFACFRVLVRVGNCTRKYPYFQQRARYPWLISIAEIQGIFQLVSAAHKTPRAFNFSSQPSHPQPKTNRYTMAVRGPSFLTNPSSAAKVSQSQALDFPQPTSFVNFTRENGSVFCLFIKSRSGLACETACFGASTRRPSLNANLPTPNRRPDDAVTL